VSDITSKFCLIVDDSKIVRKVTRNIYEAIGVSQIDEAEDGQVAFDKCQLRMPDIIMLDWHMPVKNGITFLKELRASEGGQHPVVIFCTTETNLECITDAITSGANEYVMKPYDEDIIRGKLEQLGLL
jgi:two-component system, chemotaxis family, chemotaxis protein CheY